MLLVTIDVSCTLVMSLVIIAVHLGYQSDLLFDSRPSLKLRGYQIVFQRHLLLEPIHETRFEPSVKQN